MWMPVLFLYWSIFVCMSEGKAREGRETIPRKVKVNWYEMFLIRAHISQDMKFKWAVCDMHKDEHIFVSHSAPENQLVYAWNGLFGIESCGAKELRCIFKIKLQIKWIKVQHVKWCMHSAEFNWILIKLLGARWIRLFLKHISDKLNEVL